MIAKLSWCRAPDMGRRVLGAVRFGAVLHVRKEAYNEACSDAASLQEVGNGPARNNLYALAI